MAILTGCWAYDLTIAFTSVFLAIYLYFQRSFKFWGKLNVPHDVPKFPLGSLGGAGFTKSVPEALDEVYKAHAKDKIVGLWSTFNPILLVRDLDIIRDILVKEFMSFHDRGIYVNEKVDPISGNLFMINGSKWRNLRTKLSPTFTSGKMKMMFHILVDQSAKLADVLREHLPKNNVVEMKEMMARFTTDVISSAAFGLEANSLRDANAILRKMGKSI